jgi:hypothetical protein
MLWSWEWVKPYTPYYKRHESYTLPVNQEGGVYWEYRDAVSCLTKAVERFVKQVGHDVEDGPEVQLIRSFQYMAETCKEFR